MLTYLIVLVCPRRHTRLAQMGTNIAIIYHNVALLIQTSPLTRSFGGDFEFCARKMCTPAGKPARKPHQSSGPPGEKPFRTDLHVTDGPTWHPGFLSYGVYFVNWALLRTMSVHIASFEVCIKQNIYHFHMELFA